MFLYNIIEILAYLDGSLAAKNQGKIWCAATFTNVHQQTQHLYMFIVIFCWLMHLLCLVKIIIKPVTHNSVYVYLCKQAVIFQTIFAF